MDLAENQSDEFPYWMSTNGEWRTVITAPYTQEKLIKWLENNPNKDYSQDDGWNQRCRDDFDTTSSALYELTLNDKWPADRWQEALHIWSEDEFIERSWCRMATVINDASDEVILAIVHSISQWFRAIAKNLEKHEKIFFAIANRILRLDYKDEQDRIDTADSVGRAINHPVGHVTQALLDLWHRNQLKDNQGLKEPSIRTIFTSLCDTRIDKYRYGRVLLAAHTITLFRVDYDWTKENILPLFNWGAYEDEDRSADEARSA